MVACVSPASFNFEPTLSTLRYASRARSIQNRVKQNNKYTPEDEIAYLRQQVCYPGGPIARHGSIMQTSSRHHYRGILPRQPASKDRTQACPPQQLVSWQPSAVDNLVMTASHRILCGSCARD